MRALKGIHAKVFDRPLLITPNALTPIVDYMLNPERVGFIKQQEDVAKPPMLEDFGDDRQFYIKAKADYYNVDLERKIGHIDVEGTLVNKKGQIEACIELVSYESLIDTFKNQISLGIEKVVMRFDSGGGEAYRCFGSAQAFRKLADDNNIKIIAYVDGVSASASYAWTSIADEVIANPQSQVGSIGVVVQLYNDSKYLDKMGIERSFVYAGNNKIPFDKEGAFTEDFISKLQARVDKTYGTFVNHVAQSRGLSEQAVIDTKASMFDAEEALSLGLIDKIQEIEEFSQYLTEGNSSEQFNNQPTGIEMSDISKQELDSKVKELAEVQEALKVSEGKLQAYVEQIDKLKAENKEAKEALLNIELESKNKQRKEALAEVFGKESSKVDEFATLLANDSDDKFTAFLSVLSTSKTEKAETFEELGHEKKDKAVQLSDAEQLQALADSRGNKWNRQGK